MTWSCKLCLKVGVWICGVQDVIADPSMEQQVGLWWRRHALVSMCACAHTSLESGWQACDCCLYMSCQSCCWPTVGLVSFFVNTVSQVSWFVGLCIPGPFLSGDRPSRGCRHCPCGARNLDCISWHNHKAGHCTWGPRANRRRSRNRGRRSVVVAVVRFSAVDPEKLYRCQHYVW